MKCCYLSSKPGVTRLLEGDGQHHFVPFSEHIHDFVGFDAVVLVEPYECKGREHDKAKGGLFATVLPVWRGYLAEHFPHIKLFTVRFAENSHPNHLNALDLGDQFDWPQHLANAYDCQTHWDDNLSPVGDHLLGRLQRFFRGHDNQGIIDLLAKVRQTLSHAQDRLNREGATAFATIWRDILWPNVRYCRQLSHRWQGYRPYFEVMPFYGSLQASGINHFFADLYHTLNGPKQLSKEELAGKLADFMALNAYNRLDQIQAKLNFINKKYITPELIGRVLVIDDDRDFHTRLKQSFPVFKFTSAFTAEEGNDQLQIGQFDLLILDLRLDTTAPDDQLDGLDWLPRFKADYPKLPILVVSTNQDADIHRQAILIGADAYLGKSDFDVKQWESLFIKGIAGKISGVHFSRNRYAARLQLERTILVVEDDEQWYHRISQVFDSSGYRLVQAKTPQQALDLAGKDLSQIDLILLDLLFEMEPGVEEFAGFDLLSKLRQAVPSHVPIVAISVLNEFDVTERMLEAGLTDYFRKDVFNVQLWRRRLDNYLELKKMHDKSLG